MKEMMHKNHLLNIFLLSIKNLFEPNIFKWVLYTTILTLIALSLLSFGIVYYVKDWLDTGIPFLGNFLMYGATLAAIWGSTILFVPTSTIIFSLFQDKIIDLLTQTRKFAMLDRQFLKDQQKELNFIKCCQILSPDLIF